MWIASYTMHITIQLYCELYYVLWDKDSLTHYV